MIAKSLHPKTSNFIAFKFKGLKTFGFFLDSNERGFCFEGHFLDSI